MINPNKLIYPDCVWEWSTSSVIAIITKVLDSIMGSGTLWIIEENTNDIKVAYVVPVRIIHQMPD